MTGILQLIYYLAVAVTVLLAADTETGIDGSGNGDLLLSVEEPEVEGAVNEEFINSLSQDIPSLFEGDIILTESQRIAIEGDITEDPTQPQLAITLSESRRWDGGSVPYVISSTLSSKARNAIDAAIREYSTRTCIRLYPRGSEQDYILFYKGSGCSSSVGRVGGGQRISIGSGCEYKGIVIHEIFHALGRWHEQSRPDRDNYITINYGNMKDGVEVNFAKLTSQQVKTQGVNYDYGSIMHYSAYAFSRNGRPTITPRDQRVSASVLGQRQRLSANDIQHITALYCSVETANWGTWGSWSSCSRTCNGGIRTRTRSCVGGSSCIGSNIQEEDCNVQVCLVVPEWSSWSSWSGCSVSCGGGRQSRSRRCINGNACIGNPVEYRSCNTEECPLPQGTWDSWSVWSLCSLSCGGGVQRRTRQCLSEPCEGSTAEQQPCNPQQCPTTGLSGMRHEGCYQVLTGSGLFLMEGSTAELRGNPFQRTEPVEKCARAAVQRSYPIIGVSAGYCISGGSGLSSYTKVSSRHCRDGKGAYQGGRFHMDVYTITDSESVSDQAQQEQRDEDLTLTTSSSSTGLRTSIFFTILLMAFTITLFV